LKQDSKDLPGFSSRGSGETAAPLRILLVEDSPSDARLLQEYLAMASFERFDVTHVERLDDALETLGHGAFDVVLLDLSLPDSAGHATFLRIQQEAPHIPIVVLSGMSDETLGIDAVRRGIQDYLVKGQADERQIARAIRYATERGRLENALRQSEERFRLALDAAHALVYDVDISSGRAISLHGLTALLGHKVDDKISTREWWLDQIHPEDRDRVERLLQQALENSSGYSVDHRVLHRDGHCIHVQDIGQIVRDAAGRAVRVVGSVVDISGRRQLESALRQSEERLRLAVNAANEAIWDWNLIDGKVTWNETSTSSLGLSDLAGDPAQWWTDHLHPDDRDRVITSLQAVLDSTGDSWTGEYRFLRADGSWADIYDRAFIARDAAGKATRAVGAMLDLTERKRAEAALRESEERYRRLSHELERIVEQRTADLRRLNRTLMMITDCNEAIVRAHREADLLRDVCRTIVDIGGYRMAWVGFAQDDEGKTVVPAAHAGAEHGYLTRIHISWADNEYGRGPTGLCIRTGVPAIAKDFLTDPALARWREEALRSGFRSSIALPLRVGDQIIGSLNIYAVEPEAFADEQIRVLQELADDLAFGIAALRTRIERDQALDALERSSAELRTLASELTHTEERERRRLAQAIHDHLQQLLVAAKLCSDTLRRRCQTEPQLEVVGQLNEFIKESIEVARSLTFELSPPILYDVGLAAALQWLGRWMLAKHALSVDVNADRQVEPANEDVRVLLFQATRELLFNVVKHAQVKAASVQMGRIEGDRVQIVVSDEGIGFDPEMRRGDPNLEGGFGLFSIRGRLGLLGGRMEITSSPGRGSRFTLVAPLGG
jgi:PAS domain S-box-containing protein